jgi:hypothetical protein
MNYEQEQTHLPDVQVKQNVKKGYADIVRRSSKKKFLPSFLQCCNTKQIVIDVSKKIGYSEEETQECS